ncbi:MAG: UDP-galactopyranose mutase [Clostridia bacterium]|nr:UDP-galactopyranose mutase [Clostridia bacterium]
MKRYDYLIVGAGLFGSVFAREAMKNGKTCLVVERRAHVGGNVYTEEADGIVVHRYGAHVFHTSDKRVWDYMNEFAAFNHFVNSPLADYHGERYHLPFNMNTFRELWGVTTPEEARHIIAEQTAAAGTGEPQNLEEQALRLVGRDIYEKLVKGYSEKQWGRDCKDLPPYLIRRIPLRFTYDNNYYDDTYQGVPIGGYTPIVEKLLEGADVLTDTDYFDFIRGHAGIAAKTIFTGPIDEYFGKRYGELEYRTLRFEAETMPTDDYQGNAVINYTAQDVPYTRVIEHKHFDFGTQAKTVVTREYSAERQAGDEPYYPIHTPYNLEKYEKYLALARERGDVIFGGRLGEYRYYDMDDAISAALDLAAKELG